MAKTVTSKDSDEILLKLLIIGDQSVGKTCLMLRFCDNNFDPVMVSTIGIDMRTKKIQLDGQQVKLQIWDTAGQERFRATTIGWFFFKKIFIRLKSRNKTFIFSFQIIKHITEMRKVFYWSMIRLMNHHSKT